MSEDKGWELLNSVDNEGGSGTYVGADGSIMTMFSDGSVQYMGADWSFGRKNADGSGYYSGADGSVGNMSSDGSGHYSGADGSIGTLFSDGSSQYMGADGSFKYKRSPTEGTYFTDDGSIVSRFSDGSAQYNGADGSFGYKNADGSGYYSGADGSFGNRSAGNRKKTSSESDDKAYSYSGYSSSYVASKSAKSTRKTESEIKNLTGTIGSIINSFWSAIWALLFLMLIIYGICCFAAGELLFFKKADKTETHPGEIRLENSASYYKGENYYDTIIKLRNQGFSDIRITPLNDLKTGIFQKEGKIETIEVNGISDFKSGSWVSEKSVVSIAYHSLTKKEKNGFISEKNAHLVIYGIDIQVPNYLIEDTHNETQVVYRVKEDEETVLLIFSGDEQLKNELGKFETYFLSETRDSSAAIGEKEIDLLGKKNDKVYSVHIAKLKAKAKSFYVMLVSPNNSKTEYYSDYKAILSGIYVPKETEIRLDFNPNDYKGKNYEEVVELLKNKGFINIQVQNLQDVILGIFSKDGQVERITINGSSAYKSGDWIDKQSEIIISYHGKK